jgi:hypothetical protein
MYKATLIFITASSFSYFLFVEVQLFLQKGVLKGLKPSDYGLFTPESSGLYPLLQGVI